MIIKGPKKVQWPPPTRIMLVSKLYLLDCTYWIPQIRIGPLKGLFLSHGISLIALSITFLKLMLILKSLFWMFSNAEQELLFYRDSVLRQQVQVRHLQLLSGFHSLTYLVHHICVLPIISPSWCGSANQEAHKRMRVKKLPTILALHLKRFKYVEQYNRHIKVSIWILSRWTFLLIKYFLARCPTE